MKEGLHSDRVYIHDELGVEGDLGGGGYLFNLSLYGAYHPNSWSCEESLHSSRSSSSWLPMNKPAGFLDQGQQRAGAEVASSTTGSFQRSSLIWTFSFFILRILLPSKGNLHIDSCYRSRIYFSAMHRRGLKGMAFVFCCVRWFMQLFNLSFTQKSTHRRLSSPSKWVRYTPFHHLLGGLASFTKASNW